MNKIAFTLSLAAIASVSVFAQSRSTFSITADMVDMGITESAGGLIHTVANGADPRLIINGETYLVDSVFGFWVLRDNDPDILNPSNTNFGVWSVQNNASGDGEIAGWKATPPTGIKANESVAFEFDGLNWDDANGYGLHVRLDREITGLTGDTYFVQVATEPVPEPASLLALGAGAAFLLRRRRQNA